MTIGGAGYLLNGGISAREFKTYRSGGAKSCHEA
jgi:hypothetical protein